MPEITINVPAHVYPAEIVPSDVLGLIQTVCRGIGRVLTGLMGVCLEPEELLAKPQNRPDAKARSERLLSPAQPLGNALILDQPKPDITTDPAQNRKSVVSVTPPSDQVTAT